MKQENPKRYRLVPLREFLTIERNPTAYPGKFYRLLWRHNPKMTQNCSNAAYAIREIESLGTSSYYRELIILIKSLIDGIHSINANEIRAKICEMIHRESNLEDNYDSVGEFKSFKAWQGGGGSGEILYKIEFENYIYETGKDHIYYDIYYESIL